MDMNLYQKLSAVSSEVGTINKDATVSAGYANYKAVTHDAVTAQVRAAMEKYGVVAITSTDEFSETREELTNSKGISRTVFRCTVKVSTQFINCDDPSDSICITAYGTGEDGGDKAVGKAISYATKYSLLKGLMLETGDDTDKDASHDGTRKSYPADDDNKEWINDISALVVHAKAQGSTAQDAVRMARQKYKVSKAKAAEIETAMSGNS